MEILIAVVISLFAGYYIRKLVDSYEKYKALKELDEVVNEKLTMLREKIIPSRLEEENGILFLYNRNTNEFLGQGSSFEELEKNMREKYPDKLFNVPQEELDIYIKD